MERTTSLDTQSASLAELLRTAQVGDVVGFDDMSRKIGADVRKRRYVMKKALTALIEEEGIRFVSVFNVGLKRTNMSDIIGISDRALRKIRMAAINANNRICLQVESERGIDDSALLALNARRSLFGAIEALATIKNVKKIEDVAACDVLPYGRVIDITM